MSTFFYSHQTFLRVPIEVVWNFFSRPKNLERLSPPFLGLSVDLTHDQRISKDLSFIIKLKPIRCLPALITRTKILEVNSPNRFIDQAHGGGFISWHHRHDFKAEPNGTVVEGHITYKPVGGPLAVILNHIIFKPQISHMFKFRSTKLYEIFL